MGSVCTLGDLLLDVVVKLHGLWPKATTRTARHARAAAGKRRTSRPGRRQLGARARFVGKRGEDAAGELVEADLRRHGVDVFGPPPTGRNGVVVSLVDLDGSRTMVSDRGVAPELAPEELEPEWFEDADWLHLSGYSLMGEPIGAAAERAVELARGAGARISVDLSSVNLIREFGRDAPRAAVRAHRPDVVFGNEAEHAELPDRTRPSQDRQARRAGRHDRRARLPEPVATRRHRHDGCGRRACRGVPRRRRRARDGGCRPVRRAAREPCRDPRLGRGSRSDGRRRARDDDRRARFPARRGRRRSDGNASGGSARRAPCPRRSACWTARSSSASPRRSSSASIPRLERSALGSSQRVSRAARSGRRRLAEHLPSAASRASASWAPEASAAYTGGRAGTSLPICSSSRDRRSSSSAPA